MARPAEAVTWASVAVAAGACSLVVAFPDLLRGNPAMNGSARGTTLVALVVAVPLLAGSLVLGGRGYLRALPVRLGCQAYLLYNALLMILATPFDDLFLAYVAWLSTALWALLLTCATLDARWYAGLFGDRLPQRGLAAYVLVVVLLNALAWLRPILVATGRSRSEDGVPGFLAGTGLTTSPTYVQDLAFWLPVMAVGAVLLWRRRPWGYVVVSGGLVLWVVESVGIAVDQWLGAAADPASPAVSATATPPFVIAAVAGLVPVLVLMRRLQAGPPLFSGVSGARGWVWALESTQVLVGVSAALGGLRMAADGFGMPRPWLAGTGFDSWTWPGVFLVVGVAVPQLTAAVLVAVRHRAAPAVAWVSAVGLVVWIVVQVAVLQRFHVMQPAIAAVGLLQVGLLVGWLGLPGPPGRPAPSTTPWRRKCQCLGTGSTA